jgi:dihydropteroate synthase
MDRPLVMGILNITPDSFYDGGKYLNEDVLLKHVQRMKDEGVDIIDIGGQSTRPGSERISAEGELARVLPVIKKIHSHFPELILSIDTYYSLVAKASVDAGVSIVNDVSAGKMDASMISTVANMGNVPYVCMHMQGSPETMQQNPQYGNVVSDIIDFFKERIYYCHDAGINDIILDPGFGFGKTIEHNFQLLHELAALQICGKPIMVGLSRKGMIWKTLGVKPEQALNGTTACHMAALMDGANILRVHDVKEARETITLFEAYKKGAPAERPVN